MKKRRAKPIVLTVSIVLLVLVVTYVIIWLSGGIQYSTNEIEEYLSHGKFDKSAGALLPELSELEGYRSIFYQYDMECIPIKQYEGTCLHVTYDEEEYERAKVELERTYTFYDKEDRISTATFTSPAEFIIQDYTFRMVDLRSAANYSDKYVPLIATNDKNCTISYLFYYDWMSQFWTEDDGGIYYSPYAEKLGIESPIAQ